MMRIFFKIFLIFWLSNAAVFSGAFALHWIWEQKQYDRLRPHLTELANTAVDRYRSGGRRVLRNMLREIHDQQDIGMHLIDPDGRPLNRPPRSELRGLLDSPPGHITPWDNPAGRFAVDIIEVPREEGIYRFIAFDELHHLDRRRPGDSLPVWLIAMALASGLIAWLFTRPIRQLQSITQQLAGGDLSARVPETTSKRRDALGDLGRELNRMADQLQSLIDSQHRLLRDVSHELRSPLARIQIALGLAEKRSSGAGGELDRIRLELDRLESLISQVLLMTRLDSGVDELERAPLSLIALAREVAEDAAFEGSTRDVGVNIIGDETLSVAGDRDKLRSALENVVRNALRYTAEGSTITIEIDRHDEQNCIHVRDHGPGVPADDLKRLFDAFYRCGEARDTDSGGHGVGLAIARAVLIAHGGSVHAANAADGGLIVSLCLPRG